MSLTRNQRYRYRLAKVIDPDNYGTLGGGITYLGDGTFQFTNATGYDSVTWNDNEVNPQLITPGDFVTYRWEILESTSGAIRMKSQAPGGSIKVLEDGTNWRDTKVGTEDAGAPYKVVNHSSVGYIEEDEIVFSPITQAGVAVFQLQAADGFVGIAKLHSCTVLENKPWGPNIVPNPNLTNVDDWTLNSPWTANNSRIFIDGSQVSPTMASVTLTEPLKSGNTYVLMFHTSTNQITGGQISATIDCSIGGGSAVSWTHDAGTVAVMGHLVAGDSNNELEFLADATGGIEFDSVYLREIL